MSCDLLENYYGISPELGRSDQWIEISVPITGNYVKSKKTNTEYSEQQNSDKMPR